MFMANSRLSGTFSIHANCNSLVFGFFSSLNKFKLVLESDFSINSTLLRLRNVDMNLKIHALVGVNNWLARALQNDHCSHLKQQR